MIRKIVILFTLVGLFSGRIYAQLNVPQESQKLEKIDYIQKVEKYRKMRRAGSVLTVVGSILVVAGVATAAVSFVYSEGSAVNAGAGVAVAGYACLAPGIPLWIVGGAQHKKYSKKVQELSIKVNSRRQAQGLTLTYRF